MAERRRSWWGWGWEDQALTAGRNRPAVEQQMSASQKLDRVVIYRPSDIGRDLLAA